MSCRHCGAGLPTSEDLLGVVARLDELVRTEVPIEGRPPARCTPEMRSAHALGEALSELRTVEAGLLRLCSSCHYGVRDRRDQLLAVVYVFVALVGGRRWGWTSWGLA